MKCYCLNKFLTPLKKQEIDTPTPSGEEVLLKIKASGICHSDIHFWEGYYDIGEDKKLELKDRGIKLPMILGHEIVGTIVLKGSDVIDLEIGDNCIVYPWIGCGNCESCNISQENYCVNPRYLGIQRSGGFAEYVLVPSYKYLIDIKNNNPVTTAQYACSGLTTYSAIKKIDQSIYTKKPIVIFGAGGLGLTAISILKALNSFGVLVVEKDESKRKAALKAGALDVFDLFDENLESKLLEYNNGNKYKAVIDLIGNNLTSRISFNVLDKFSTLVIVGMFGGLSSWPIALIPMKAIKIIGSYVGNLNEFYELMDLVIKNKITPTPVQAYHFDRINEAMDDLRTGNVIGRAVLVHDS
ncbi:Zn-dependent 6-hydroxyhexanoate dehydrogenase [Candidatus Kinetoplastibacterium desouzaii TCC079E]|uniref:Zn-dependent 6-hydroxyhexanoate dehydrogenase n=1 Tax=Candidatus Kinetoplastidibacterium desouzai TCC079E TaxID=1208919 RepID=M1LUC5_9PROT|nr:alcohol dehydrogenase [Candidatus Kinetoplastibacterium desouzaii]AGF46904.1 Zn-dependent 6-hydroxyhexanoate dehydrogenase [Candidatus Kinetoplastibacterium desouzaii TCC079E]